METTRDGRFECVVRRMGPYEGRFTITNRFTWRALRVERGQLSYGGPFGPDIEGVAFRQAGAPATGTRNRF